MSIGFGWAVFDDDRGVRREKGGSVDEGFGTLGYGFEIIV